MKILIDGLNEITSGMKFIKAGLLHFSIKFMQRN